MFHKYYDVILAWVEGKEVEFRSVNTNKWFTYKGNYAASFDDNTKEWRIKANTNQLKYRLALIKSPKNEYQVIVVNEEEEERVGDSYNFVRWVSDWEYLNI